MNMTEFNNMQFEDFDKLDYQDLKALVSQKAKSANKRLDRISKNSQLTQISVKEVNKSGGRFGVKGRSTKNQLIKEAKRIQTFNKSKAGNVRGASKISKEVLEVNGMKSKPKTKKKRKSLKDIHSDITKKYKQKLKTEGKEAAKKYRKRARAQEESIRRKRKKELEEKKAKPEPTPKEPEPTPDDIIDDFDDYAEEVTEEEEKKPQYHNKNQADMAGQETFMLEQKAKSESKKQEATASFMPDVSDDWSSAFID